jgi:hypothetical protein
MDGMHLANGRLRAYDRPFPRSGSSTLISELRVFDNERVINGYMAVNILKRKFGGLDVTTFIVPSIYGS